MFNSYLETNKQRYLDELIDLLRIPSISAKTEHAPDMQRCAEKVKEALLAAGADKAEIIQTAGHPIVYGEKLIDPTCQPCWSMVIMMCSLQIRWNYGIAVHLIQ